MTIATIVMLVILAISLAIIAIVAIGMQGNLAHRAPGVAEVMRNTARHLNGDAPPPQGMVNFFEERRSGSSAPSADTGEQPRIT